MRVATRQRPDQEDRAAALPPLRPAALCWAVVPPCLEDPPDPLSWPPRLEASGELAILAARCLDMPLSLRASYCFSFFDAGALVCGHSMAPLLRRGACGQ